MRTTVSLQEPFTYSLIPLVIFITIIIGLTIYLIFSKKKSDNNKENEEVKKIPDKNIKDIPAIKNKHIQKLDEIENEFNNQKITLRKAYQLISETVRVFVFEVTDITTQNYSLREIKKLNMPNLYDLIKEYYEPEFASKTVGDLEISINKARRIIKEWK